MTPQEALDRVALSAHHPAHCGRHHARACTCGVAEAILALSEACTGLADARRERDAARRDFAALVALHAGPPSQEESDDARW